jgi:hypothetical protein
LTIINFVKSNKNIFGAENNVTKYRFSKLANNAFTKQPLEVIFAPTAGSCCTFTVTNIINYVIIYTMLQNNCGVAGRLDRKK